MANSFSRQARGPRDPAVTVFDVVPSDAADLPHVTTALNVATPGTVRVTTVDGSVGEISINPGQAFPIRANRVWLTGTTATGIRGLA